MSKQINIHICNHIIWILLICTLGLHKVSSRREPQSFVYSAQYHTKYEQSDVNNQFKNIKIAKDVNLIFVASGELGIQVIDPAQSYNIVYQYKTDYSVNGFAVSKDGNYVYLTYQKKFTLFSYQSKSSFILLSQENSQDIEYQDMILSNQEDLVYVLQPNGYVMVINVQNKQSPFVAGSFQYLQQHIYQGDISIDDKWFLICQGYVGVSIYNIKKNLDGTITPIFVGNIIRSYAGLITKDLKLAIITDIYNGIAFLDFTVITSAIPSDYPLNLNYKSEFYWPTKRNLPAPYSFCLSNDQKFLFVGVLSQGIYVFDIQDQNNDPVLYQTISQPLHGLSVKLSADEQDLFFANGSGLYVFPKIQTNLNEQYFNLFNGHVANYFSESNTKYYWRCQIDNQNNLLYGIFDEDGLWVLDVEDPQNMKSLVKSFFPPHSSGFIDIIYALQDYKYIVVPTYDEVDHYILRIYEFDLSDKKTLKFISGIKYNTDQKILDMDTNNNDTMLVCGMGNILVFVDITDLQSISLTNTWKLQHGMKGEITGVTIIKNDKYLISTIRSYGYFVLDISDILNIRLMKYIESLGAEYLYPALNGSNYCYIIDGLNGVHIIDTDSLPEVNIISTIKVPGWSNDILLLKDEKLMFISTMQKSMITMVDISDIKNPIIVSKYEYEGQNGISSCANDSGSYIYVQNNFGIRALPIKSEVVTHVEIQENLGNSQKLKKNSDETLQVGQNIQINMVLLYQSLDVKVQELKFYQFQILQDLPNWIVYNHNESSITINIVKEAVDPTNQNQPLLNVILVKTLSPIIQSDFLYIMGECTTDQNKIWECLVSQICWQIQIQKFQDDQEIIVQNFTYTDDDEKKCLGKRIKHSLLQSIQYTPIYLLVKSSLKLNLSPNVNNKFIETISKFVRVSIQTPKKSGFFIYKQDISVDISINDEKNEIVVYGSVMNVNNVLHSKIILFPQAPNDLNTIMAYLLIEDIINHQIEKNLLINEIPFITKKQNLMINSEKVIQNQLNQAYSNGEIEIISDFSFQFSSSTFIQPEHVGEIKYDVFILKDGEYCNFDENDWIQYNQQDLKLYGNPPQSSYNSIVRLKIVGHDEYNEIQDFMKIEVSKLPVLFVIQWISQIIGPIFGAFGFYKYRNLFYNALFKKRNRYSKVSCQINQRFVMKIPLISREVEQSKQMIEILLMKQDKHSQRFDLSKLTKKSSELQIDECVQEEDQEQIKNQKNDQSPQTQLQQYDLSPQTPLQHFTEKDNIQELQLDQYELSPSIQKLTQTKIKNKKNIHRSKTVWNTDRNDIAHQFHDKIIRAKIHFPSSATEKKYLNQEGKINMEAIISDMVVMNEKFKVLGSWCKASDFKDELMNKHSILYQCIKCLFARYFISFDQKTLLLSEYIRYYGKKNCYIHTQNDWYKQFVRIESDESLDEQGHTVSFPKISLILENLNIVLMHLKLISSKFLSLNQLRELNINPYLIKLILKSDALGINVKKPSSIFPSNGESIHLKSHQLRSVQSFKYSPGGTCFSLKRCFNVEYEPYGPTDNMQFPNWLELIMQPGVIILSGTPQIQDMEEILIRFYGNQGYIYRSFTLRIQDEDGNIHSSPKRSVNNYKKSTFSKQEQGTNILIKNNEKSNDTDSILIL